MTVVVKLIELVEGGEARDGEFGEEQVAERHGG